MVASDLAAEGRGKSVGGRAGLGVVGLLATVGLLTTAGWPEWRSIAVLAMLAVLGLLLEALLDSELAPDAGRDGLERLAYGVGLGLVLVLAVAGLVHLVPGPMPRWALAALGGVLLVVLALAVARRVDRPYRFPRRSLVALSPILVVGGALRLIDLGYSELQGDETQVLFRAAALVQGFEEALLAHRKGPGELLFTAFTGQLVGRVAEADARLPYALVSLAGVVLLFLVGRELFNARAGLLAAGLWAINGYAVAFGRIVQYESLVVLLTSLATLSAWRALTIERRAGGWAGLATLLLSASAVCGFNTLTLGVPAVYLLGRWSWARAPVVGMLRRPAWIAVLVGMVAGLTLAGGTFLRRVRPDLLEYAGWRLGGDHPLNNLDLLAAVTVGYTSLPYFVVTGGAGLLAICYLVGGGSVAMWKRALALGLGIGFVVLALTRGQPTWLALVVWTVGLGAVLARCDLADSWKAVALGFALPLGLYTFVVARPGTHWHELYPALLLLVGAAADRAIVALPRRVEGVATMGGGLLLLVLAAYPIGTFLPIWPVGLVPPAVVSWYRPELSPLRSTGTFGFPHQHGWKAVARLEEDGALPLPYDSNEKAQIAQWYLPHAESCGQQGRSYVLAPLAPWWGVHGPRTRPNAIPGAVSAEVTVGGETTLVVYTRQPIDANVASVRAEDAAGWYDAERSTLDRPLRPRRDRCDKPQLPGWLVDD